MTDNERRWLNNASRYGGSFVKAFAEACFCADGENWIILKPVFNQISQKYTTYFIDQEIKNEEA